MIIEFFFTRSSVIFTTSADNFNILDPIFNVSFIPRQKLKTTTQSFIVSVLLFYRHVEIEGCIKSSDDTDVMQWRCETKSEPEIHKDSCNFTRRWNSSILQKNIHTKIVFHVMSVKVNYRPILT